MSSGRSKDEAELRLKIWTMRQQVVRGSPRSFQSIANELNLPKSVVHYKYKAYMKQIGKSEAIATKDVMKAVKALPCSSLQESAQTLADHFLAGLRSDFDNYNDPIVRAGIAGTSVRLIKFKQEAEGPEGSLSSADELTRVFINIIKEEPEDVQRRLVSRLIANFGESLRRVAHIEILPTEPK